MSRKRPRKELQSPEAFRMAVAEEISVSSEFGLPMTLISAAVEGEWGENALRRALDSLRTADLVTQPEPGELFIVLPNTPVDTARIIEERLEKTVPESDLGVAAYTRGDTSEDLLRRARAARRAQRDSEPTP